MHKNAPFWGVYKQKSATKKSLVSFRIRTIPSVLELHQIGKARLSSQTILPVGNHTPPQRIIFYLTVSQRTVDCALSRFDEKNTRKTNFPRGCILRKHETERNVRDFVEFSVKNQPDDGTKPFIIIHYTKTNVKQIYRFQRISGGFSTTATCLFSTARGITLVIKSKKLRAFHSANTNVLALKTKVHVTRPHIDINEMHTK